MDKDYVGNYNLGAHLAKSKFGRFVVESHPHLIALVTSFTLVDIADQTWRRTATTLGPMIDNAQGGTNDMVDLGCG